jgi:ribosomal protein S27AE
MVTSLTEYSGICPTCGKNFVSNHLNRRYCSNKCKNFKNNSKARVVRHETKDVVGILQTNRKILSTYAHNSLISVQELKGLGFNFAFHTHNQKQDNGAIVVCVYDYGYVFGQNKLEVIILKLV